MWNWKWLNPGLNLSFWGKGSLNYCPERPELGWLLIESCYILFKILSWNRNHKEKEKKKAQRLLCLCCHNFIYSHNCLQRSEISFWDYLWDNNFDIVGFFSLPRLFSACGSFLLGKCSNLKRGVKQLPGLCCHPLFFFFLIKDRAGGGEPVERGGSSLRRLEEWFTLQIKTN